jgi:hypothetical protein
MTRLTLAICLLPFEFSEEGKPSPYYLVCPSPPGQFSDPISHAWLVQSLRPLTHQYLCG